MLYIGLALFLSFTFGVFGTPHPDNMILGVLWTILVHQTGELDELADYVRCND